MVTPRSKFHCNWETSNGFFVSIQRGILFFLKDKLSAIKLSLSSELKLIDDPQNLRHFSFGKLKSLRD
jgi:hypothetical protein